MRPDCPIIERLDALSLEQLIYRHLMNNAKTLAANIIIETPGGPQNFLKKICPYFVPMCALFSGVSNLPNCIVY
jgi:hypothetical protein